MIISLILMISILAGQLIKFPILGILGPTLLDISIGLLTILGFYQIKLRFKKPPGFIKFGFLFILISILSLLFTPLHLDNTERILSFSYTLRFIIYLAFSYLIYSGAFPDFKKRIPMTLLISGVGLAILGLIQFIVWPNLEGLESLGWDPHYFRTVSTFLDPNFAGAYFVLTLVILSGAKDLSWIRVTSFIIIFLALLTTFSRSSYLMFLVSGLMLSFKNKSKDLFFKALLLFFILMTSFSFYSKFIATPRNIDRQQSAISRVNTWQQGFEIFKRSPILGVGFNSYRYAIREYMLADSKFLESRGSSSNDSSLLFAASTTGIVGLIFYTLFLFSIPFTLVLPGLLIHSFFANSLFYPFILIWILLLAVVYS